MVQLLLSYGAKPDVGDRYGNTPIHIAVERGNQEIVNLLINHKVELNCRDQMSRTPLHLAVSLHKPTILQSLLKAGARVNAFTVD